MNKQMRILQICPRIPFPPNDGGSIGVYNITKHLALRGHEITMLAFSEEEVPEALLEYARVIPVAHDTRTKVHRIFSNLISNIPYTISKYQTDKMEEALRTVCTEAPFDVAHVDHLHMAPYGAMVKREFDIPYCLREHNYETTIYARFAETQSISLLKSYMKMQTARIRRFEREQIGLTDLCIPITQEDARNILAETDAPLQIIPAGVDLEKLGILDPADEDPCSILILGSLTWKPNIDAASWFLDEIWPLILRQEPSATVTIAGMSPPVQIRKRASDRIRVPGFVEDLLPLLRRSRVLAIPLRIGGGMRIKMLEFFAYGKAVVSTSIGAEGSEAEDGIHYLCADSPNSFADSVVSLFRSTDLRHDLGAAGRRFVEDGYSWTRIAERFEEAYHRVIRS